MRSILYLLCCLIFLACQESSPKTVDTKPIKEKAEVSEKKPVILKDCTFDGNINDGNQMTLENQHQVLAILANESTMDANLGDSHRVLTVKDQTDCSVIFQETLPINRSADFPYQIADLNYNNTQPFVAIKGYDKVYCYDIKNKKLLTALEPKYINQREAKDAQSGQIVHVELWEDYIIGYALDAGTFVFKIDERNLAKAILPTAEYQPQGTDKYASLFSLPSLNGKTQFLIPQYDKLEKRFTLNTLFKAPIRLKNSIVISKDQRYALFTDQLSSNAFAIDLLKRAMVDLTTDQRAKSPKQLLKQLQNRN